MCLWDRKKACATGFCTLTNVFRQINLSWRVLLGLPEGKQRGVECHSAALLFLRGCLWFVAIWMDFSLCTWHPPISLLAQTSCKVGLYPSPWSMYSQNRQLFRSSGRGSHWSHPHWMYIHGLLAVRPICWDGVVPILSVVRLICCNTDTKRP